MPPATARLGSAAANSRAIRSIRSAGMPVSCAAAAGVSLRERRPAAAGAPRSAATTPAIASASAASVPGRIGEPFVGVETGEIHPRRGVDELGHVALREPVRVGEAALVLGRGEPGLEKVGAERQDVLGAARSRAPAAGRGRTPGGWPRASARGRTAPSAPPGRRARRSIRRADRRSVPRPAPLTTATLPPASPSLPASRAIASSQVISANLPSALRAIGALMRPGLYRPWSDAWPREQSLPWLTGCSGFPSSLTARPSRVRTCTPQPAAHSVQVLAYKVATPGIWSSDCTR